MINNDSDIKLVGIYASTDYEVIEMRKRMIKIEKTEVVGWEAAIRGMRNPMNSWEKSDTKYKDALLTPGAYRDKVVPEIGPNDLDRMKKLVKAGTDHRKFMRMIAVYVDITAPLYWWKEFDTYKVGTVANSCSTMHKIADKEFELDDFSVDHLGADAMDIFCSIVNSLNSFRDYYVNYAEYDDLPDKKDIWWQMIQLLPSSYNQKRTVMMSYEVLANIYKSRKNHELDEWSDHRCYGGVDEDGNDVTESPNYFGFCDWIETLPYSELITGEFNLKED